MARIKEKGQGLAEFALALPILLMIIFGMIEAARLVQAYLVVQHASREAARYAVVGLPSEADCQAAMGHVCESVLGTGAMCPTEYADYRVAEIKERARSAAIGLPIDPNETDPTRPRHLGVTVWGQPTFYESAVEDCPGVPGARVEVRVFFNLPVITPVLSGALPTIRVTASTQMINEGFQTWVGAQAPPVLDTPPPPDPLDTDGDGLTDEEEAPADQCPYPDDADSDDDDIPDGQELAQGWDPCDPDDPYLLPATPTPTDTPTPTPIPVGVNEPLRTDDTVVTGTGDPDYPPQVQIWDWTTHTLIGTGIVEASGTFRIDVPPLVGGHTIRAIASYGYDDAPVLSATHTPTNTATPTDTPTVTSTPTHTATPTPAAKISILIPTPPAGGVYSCSDDIGQPVDLTVAGTGWPADAGTVVYFGWNAIGASGRSKTGNATATPDAQGDFTASFTVVGSAITEGAHTLYAKAILVAPYPEAHAPFYVPCSSVPTPTPTFTVTPTRTPTFTPTPVRKPDLIITDLSTQPGIIPAWTPVAIDTTVFNDSTGPCNEFFWTDLYVYTDPLDSPAPSQPGVAWHGLTSLGPNTAAPLTFLHTFTISGTHYLYTQADSYEFVNESDEDNNVSQPLTVTVEYVGTPAPTPTETATPTNAGSISGSVWAFIDGQLVVPSEKVDMSLWQGGSMMATTETDLLGGYLFDSVQQGTDYTVLGWVEIDFVLYSGSVTGVDVVENQETSNVDVILYPPSP